MSDFKVCSCGATWLTMDAFLSDPAVEIIGFQADLDQPQQGAYMFNHLRSKGGCNSTLALKVDQFSELLEAKPAGEVVYGTRQCPGHCARIDDLDGCQVRCRNAMIRDVACRIREWPKKE